MAPRFFLTFVAFLIALSPARAVPIERIWLTPQTNDPARLVINWETDAPADSRVEFGASASELGQKVVREEKVTLHHVEVPFGMAVLHYRVLSGSDSSAIQAVNADPRDVLRVAVIGDAGYAKSAWADAVLREYPHLLVSAGDHVPALHSGQPVPRETTTAFSKLVSQAPKLFSTTPWLPLLGNHDREIRPRGAQPPPEPVYDIEATAFREFFALPPPEWHWHFDFPDFGVRFIALDLNHLSDQGTTWQTCHSPRRDGEQFAWYRDLIGASRQPFVVTLYNERNSQVRGLEGGEWGRMISRGSLAITGFGSFAERAEVDGFSYYNTSVGGTGSRYPDPKSAVLKSEDNFVLLTFRREPQTLRVELKSLSGAALDTKEFTPRSATAP